MALIKCKECGHEVSDKASACPNCGCPITKETIVSEEPVKKSKGKLWFLLVLLLCLLVGGGYYAYATFCNGGNNKDAIVELTPEFINAIQKYDKLGPFSEGYAAVLKDGKWGYINIKGEEVISCQYSNPYEEYTSGAFHEGLAAVQKEGKWGYIDTKGKEVVPIDIEAEIAGHFSEGRAFIYKDESNFVVIDMKGNTIFKGNCDLSSYLGPNVEESLLPHYSQSKLFVPLEYDKFAVYDASGNKESEVNQETKEKTEEQNETDKPYTVFSKENGDIEDYQWYTQGLKDADGNEVIPAIYDGIMYEGFSEQIAVNNGVVLVMLNEVGEGEAIVEGFGGDFDTGNYNCHYGYADLKGNDTFSKELKEKCRESKEKAVNILFQQEVEEKWRIIKEGPDWLQGTWRLQMSDDYGNNLGYIYIVFNHGNCKTYLNGELTLDQTYTVDGDRLTFEKGHYQLDNYRQIVIGANGQEMQKISNDTSYRPTSSTPSSSYSSSGESSNQRSYRFSSAPDVIGYLADKTFYNGSRRMRIRPDGVWLNDYCATGAPNVERFESWKALVRAFTATGQRLSFLIDPIHGTVTDEAGDVFKLR